MKPHRTGGLLLLAALGFVRSAAGQGTQVSPTGSAQPQSTPAPSSPTSTAPAEPDRPIRVRASHRVDVIAPGERVETIIDRMRATRPSAGDARPADRAPLRAPDKARDGDRGPSDPRRGPEGPQRGPGPGNAPPPDRTHR